MSKELSTSQQFILQIVRSGFNVSHSKVDIDNLDWNEIFELSKRHRIFPRMYKAINHIIPIEFRNRFSIEYQNHIKKIDAMIEALHKLYALSKNEKFRFLLIKGIPISIAVYDDLYSRQINDIDILVSKDDIQRVDYGLRKIGYVQPYQCDWVNNMFAFLPFTTTRLKESKHQFEYYKFAECLSKVEVHSYLTNFKPYMQDVLWSSVDTEIENCHYNTLDLEHMSLYLFINAYDSSETYEALQKKVLLRDYIDIYECMKKYMNNIDWRRFHALITKYDFGEKYNLILNNLAELYIDDPTIAELQRNSAAVSCNYRSFPCHIKMDFISRLFFPEQRRQLAFCRLKERVCTQRKMGNPILVAPYIENEDVQYFEQYNCDLNITIKYSLRYSQQGIYVTLKIDDQLCRDLDKYMISCTILNNDLDNHILYSMFLITMVNDKAEVKMRNYESHYSTYVFDYCDSECGIPCVWDEKNNTCLFFVAFSQLGSKPFDSNSGFACQIDLYKCVYESIYHLVNEKSIDIFTSRVLSFEKAPSSM